jgi:hypothetical protein
MHCCGRTQVGPQRQRRQQGWLDYAVGWRPALFDQSLQMVVVVVVVVVVACV